MEALSLGDGWRDDVEKCFTISCWNFSVVIRLLFVTGQNCEWTLHLYPQKVIGRMPI